MIMAITERTVIGSRQVLANGVIQVRTDTVILRDGEEISRTYHRHVLAPGDSIENQDPAVQRIARVEHNSATVAAYKLSQENTA
jgi:hypothetical protein